MSDSENVDASPVQPPKIETFADAFWQTAVERFKPIEYMDSWRPTKAQLPPVVSARFRPRRPKVKSFWFAPTEDSQSSMGGKSTKANALFDPYAVQDESADLPDEQAESAPKAAKKRSRTRLKAPADVIKLEDRLFYMLQTAAGESAGGQNHGVSI